MNSFSLYSSYIVKLLYISPELSVNLFFLLSEGNVYNKLIFLSFSLFLVVLLFFLIEKIFEEKSRMDFNNEDNIFKAKLINSVFSFSV